MKNIFYYNADYRSKRSVYDDSLINDADDKAGKDRIDGIRRILPFFFRNAALHEMSLRRIPEPGIKSLVSSSCPTARRTSPMF